MTQYVCQIEIFTKYLIKCHEVTAKYPIRGSIPGDRLQAIITNKTLYDSAVAAYTQYNRRAAYSWDGETLSWKIT